MLVNYIFCSWLSYFTFVTSHELHYRQYFEHDYCLLRVYSGRNWVISVYTYSKVWLPPEISRSLGTVLAEGIVRICDALWDTTTLLLSRDVTPAKDLEKIQD